MLYFFFFNDPAPSEIYTLSLHDALPILNLAGYGNQISGVERASRAYFGAPAAMLTPAQAAFLAGLPQRPSGFNPYRSEEHTSELQSRLHLVCRLLLEKKKQQNKYTSAIL